MSESVRTAIYRERALWMRRTNGVPPEAVYLGYEEFHALCMEAGPGEMPIALKPEIFGMRVYKVAEMNHFNVTLQSSKPLYVGESKP